MNNLRTRSSDFCEMSGCLKKVQGFKSRRSFGTLEVDNRDRGGGGVRGGPRASGSGVEWEKRGTKWTVTYGIGIDMCGK